jgi:putative nucleotidyltransferase-like protein
MGRIHHSMEHENSFMNAAASSFPASSPVPGPIPVPELAVTAEFELLLACCSDLSHAERERRVRAKISEGLLWDEVLSLAEHHRLIPRVYEQLSANAGVLPKSLEAMRSRYQTNAWQALWFTSELIRIVTRFEDRGIEVLSYKGPALAQTLYADVTMRQFGDLDFLVHTTDVPRAKAASLELGYTINIQLTEREERAHLASGYEYTFNSPLGRNVVELKWQILPRFYSVNFDMNAIFRRAATVTLGGRSLRTLGPEDLLLVLCVHAAKHGWSQLSWLCDIAQLAKQMLDWSAIEEQSKYLGIERIVAVNFLLANKLIGSPIPETVQKSTRNDRAIEPLAVEITPMILESKECNTESFRYFRLMMRMRERWQDRARFLWRLAFTTTAGEWSTIRLPARLFPFYRLVRMWRLAGKLSSRAS